MHNRGGDGGGRNNGGSGSGSNDNRKRIINGLVLISITSHPHQLVDLGQPAHSGGSTPGCRPQETACLEGEGGCGHRGRCVSGLNYPECECDPGWFGVGCSTPSPSTTLGRGSYMRVALSFTPPPTSLKLQARLRTWGRASGALLHVAAQHHAAAFTLHVGSSDDYLWCLSW